MYESQSGLDATPFFRDALEAISDLWQAALSIGQDPSGLWLELTDGNGAPVAVVRFADLIERYRQLM